MAHDKDREKREKFTVALPHQVQNKKDINCCYNLFFLSFFFCGFASNVKLRTSKWTESKVLKIQLPFFFKTVFKWPTLDVFFF